MPKPIEKLIDLEKKFKLLSENLIDSLWVADVTSLKFEYITESVEGLSGYAPDEFINFSLQDRLSPESFQKVMTELTQAISNFEKGEKYIRTIEVELVHKTGKHYWGEIRARLLKGEDGKLKILGVTKNITKRKEAELEKDELIEKLNAALKENKLLRGLLPICSACKRIRDAKGKWWPLDAYVERSTQVELTHTMCLDCKEAFYGDQDWYTKRKKKSKKE